MPPTRICPQCGTRTPDAYCPEDGFQTVDASRFDAGPSDPLVGRVFEGRYLLERLIGKGGFGAVYLGRQMAVDRAVAVKVLRSELGENLQVIARFQQEARAVAGLKHPNIIQLYDFGQAADGGLYLVMEYLQGEPLDERIQRAAPLPAEDVLAIAEQTLDALADAHAQGIVHRDLKPENLYMATQGRGREVVKVLDFGIAKIADSNSGATLTGTGIAIGSPRYMSPEQCAAKPVSARSDLYSLGLVLHEALSGRPTFDADTPVGFLMAHVNTPPPPPSPNGVPLAGPLVDLIMDCIAKDPAARPASAEAALARVRAMARQDREPLVYPARGGRAQEPEGSGDRTVSLAPARVPLPGPPTGTARRVPPPPSPSGSQLVRRDRSGSLRIDAPTNVETGPGEAALPSGEMAALGGPSRAAVALAVAVAVLLLAVGAWWLLRPAGTAPEEALAAAAPVEEIAAPAPEAAAEPEPAPEPAAAAVAPEPEPEPEPEPAAAAPEPEPDPAPAIVEAEPEPAPEPPPVEEAPPPEPVVLKVTLTSKPTRAEVTRGDERLGVTPLEVRWRSDEEPPVLVLSRRGYDDLEVGLAVADAGLERLVELTRTARRATATAPKPEAPKPPAAEPEPPKPAPTPVFKPKPVSDEDEPAKPAPAPTPKFKLVE